MTTNPLSTVRSKLPTVQGRFHRSTPDQVRHIARTMLKTAEFQGTVFDYAVLLFELAGRLENANTPQEAPSLQKEAAQ